MSQIDLNKKLSEMTTEISSSNKFIDIKFEKDIMINVVQQVFSSLNIIHQNILLKYLVNMMNVIALSFNFNLRNRNAYEYQFKQNNYRDTISLLLMLLPYINDDNGEIKKKIRKLDEIFITKNAEININDEQPLYTYSNVQYGRCIRSKDITEKTFSIEFLDHNYKLLLDTIRNISNRLHVNWIDIIPITMDSYVNTDVYSNTKLLFVNNTLHEWDPYKDTFLDDNTANLLKGLSIHDIYETIANEFYYNILGIKWIIYDIQTAYREYLPMIIVLSYLININNCVNEVEWSALTNEERQIFSEEWKGFIDLVYGNINFIYKSMYIDNISLVKILRSLIFSFDNNYTDVDDAIKKNEYKPFNPNKKHNYDDIENEDEDDDEENTEQKQYTMDMMRESISTLFPKHMYEYIRQCIQKFKKTWFSSYLIVDGSIISFDQYSPIAIDESRKYGEYYPVLTQKNVYNFSKSLIHIFVKGKKHKTFPRLWKMLSRDEKTLVFNRLNNKIDDVTSWFNISRYIKNINDIDPNSPKKELKKFTNQMNIWIYDLLKKNIVNFIFESMILRGVLSTFLPTRLLSDDIYISKDKRDDEIAQHVGSLRLNKTNTLWSDSYSYVTGTTYKNMKHMTYIDKKTKNQCTTDYFEYNSTQPPWYDGYALNWISQINFFHKYLNNRVIFVTGSTGVGKSTLIPILLMYALKAIDFNNTGSVVCSQPRITPTKKNAIKLAEQLGVPIENNNYVQYKYKGTDKTKRVDHLLLKVVTDGSLLEEIQNPFFKQIRRRENKGIKKDSYTKKNQYDIIIVDESHEHNKNMDLILTLMKQCTSYNNTIKLVIVSATMDDDEPYYRRFYRDINDNRIFPFNLKLQEYGIDRINVDRRLHISPPGETTKYKIKEEYLPNADPYELIKNIITNDSSGDILFFQPGVKEITEAINTLNFILPSNMIAIPFYSKLNEDQKKFVEDISTNLKDLKISKNFPFNEFTFVNNNGDGKYDRCVIVATNIAEASLTISSLKYVIDTGNQKVDIYDYKKHRSGLIQTSISDSSRLQRKGRVGRVGPGTVYYLYKKGTTEFIKKQYDISVSDIFQELYDRLYDTDNDLCIISHDNDPNSYNNLEGNKFIVSAKRLHKMFSFKNKKNQILNVDKIISHQYYINGQFYDYYGNNNHYDYCNYTNLDPSYQTGFNYATLNDEYGKFYIIHPNEPDFIRNINGTIVKLKDHLNDNITLETYDNKYNNKIRSQKMMSFWNTMTDNLLLSLIKNESIIIPRKTELGKNISILKKELSEISIIDMDLPFVLVLLYGFSLGISTTITRMLSLFLASGGNIFKSFAIGKVIGNKYKYTNINAITNYFTNSSSDIESMLYFIQDLHNMLEKEEIIIDPMSDDNINVIKKIKENTILKINTQKQMEPIEDAMLKIIDNNKLSKSLNLNSDDKNILIQNNFMTNCIEVGIEKNILKIKKWAANRNINHEIVLKYIKTYSKTQQVIYMIENEMTKSIKKVKVTETSNIIKKSLPLITEMYNLNEKNEMIFAVTLSFIFGYKYNIAKHIVNNYYLNIYSMERESISSLKKTAYFYHLTFNKNLKNYLLYLTENVEDNTIGCIIPISRKLIRYVGNVYSNDYMTYRKNMMELPKKDLSNEFDNIDNKKLIKNIELVGSYENTINKIYHDVISYHDYNIWNNLSNIYEDTSLDIQGGYINYRKMIDMNYLNESPYILK